MRIEDILSIPRSLLLNLKLFPLGVALKMPILVRYNVAVKKMGGVEINTKQIIPAMIRIGFGDIGVLDMKYERTIIQSHGKLIFNGRAFIGMGARISTGENASIEFGNNFRNSGGLTIACEEKISFGDNVLIGWNTCILDSDYHQTFDLLSSKLSKTTRPVKIGRNVWIALGSTILKGTDIPDGCIISAGSVVRGRNFSENCIIAGNPSTIVKRDTTRHLVREQE